MTESVQIPRQAILAALATVLLADGLLLPRVGPRPAAGVFDEAAHLATGTLVAAALPSPDRAFVGGLAAGSVLIDVDHVPELWGRAWLRPRGVRPLPHSLLTPALVALRSRTGFGRGAAVGLVAHLTRDLATGRTRVALLWPLTRRPFSIRYRTYFLVLVLLAAKGGPGSAPPPRASHPGSPPPPAPTPAPAPRPGPDAQ